jgi:hypothetical protein
MDPKGLPLVVVDVVVDLVDVAAATFDFEPILLIVYHQDFDSKEVDDHFLPHKSDDRVLFPFPRVVFLRVSFRDANH